MFTHLRWIAGPLLLLLLTSQAFADAAPCFLAWMRPNRPWDRHLSEPLRDLTIVSDPDAKQAELRIPRRMMVADAAPAASPRHAVAGLAISLGVVAAGLWGLRYRPRQIPKKALILSGAVGVLLLALLSTNSFVDAKAQPIIMPPVMLFETPVTVTVVDQGNEVLLVVPPELAKKLDSIR